MLSWVMTEKELKRKGEDLNDFKASAARAIATGGQSSGRTKGPLT